MKKIDLVNAARAYMDVPFQHQGRTRLGMDCAGLLIMAAHDIGYSDFDVVDYGQIPDPKRLVGYLRDHLDLKQTDPEPGDILLMRFEEEPQHIAIVTKLPDGRQGIIHSYAQVGRVTEHGMDEKWKRRILLAFALSGVEE